MSIKNSPEKWMVSLEQPKKIDLSVIPAKGIVIECRIVIRSTEDIRYVEDTLDACRQYGSAEIIEVKEFKEK